MRNVRKLGFACVLGFCGIGAAGAATRYVDAGCAAPQAPYTNWANASTNVQAAIDAAASGDEILVAPGTYRISSAILLPEHKVLTLRSTQSRAAILDAQRLCQVLYVRGTNSLIEGFTIRNGVDPSYGGGLFLNGSNVVRDCLFTGNQAWGAGAILIYGPSVVEHSTIQSNLATYWGGGAVFYNDSRGRMNHCVVSDNVASNYGGGVAFQFEGTVSNCWIADNRALLEKGGGVSMEQGGTLVNSVVVGNRAGQDGGGIYSYQGKIAHCTVVGNAAGWKGGGIQSLHSTSTWNTIVYYNSAPTSENVWASSSAFSNCCSTPSLGGSNFTNTPAFVNGSGRDFRLASGSACIDAGASAAGIANDFDGVARPLPGTLVGPARYDVGAFEFGLPPSALGVAPGSTNLPAAATSGRQLAVAANGLWVAYASAPWISISAGKSGTGAGIVTYAVAANHGISSRTGTITVVGGSLIRTFTIQQAFFVEMSPTGGAVVGHRPALTWTAAPGATWYQVWIGRNGQKYREQWVEGVAAWTSPANMPGGSYQWWLRRWGPVVGYGEWAGPAEFSIPVAAPGALTQIEPAGEQAGYDLTYRWQKDVNATWYRLWVGRVGSGTWHDRWFELSGAGEAAINPGGANPGPAKPVQLEPAGSLVVNNPTFRWSGGQCEWWVQGWGPDGYGPWAGPLAFRIPHPAGTWHRVYVNRGATKAFDQWTQAANLPSPVALSSGGHSWWLGVWDAARGQTIWSERMDFTVP